MRVRRYNSRPPGVRGRSGFSLLELLAVITIIAILAAVIIPRIGSTTNRAKKDSCERFKSDINSAVEKYVFDNGDIPNDISEIANNEDYIPGPIPVCPVTNAPYTLDPSTGRVSGHVH